MSTSARLPVMIEQYLEKLRDDSVPTWQKETVVVMLTNIKTEIEKELHRYEVNKITSKRR